MDYIDQSKWALKWNLNQFDLALSVYGVGRKYLYVLMRDERKEEPRNTTLSTLDALYNVMAARFVELGEPVPDNLWENLIIHEWIDESEL